MFSCDFIEKPKNRISNYAITGLYFFDNNVIKYSKNLITSKRGETEITDLLKKYFYRLIHYLLYESLVYKEFYDEQCIEKSIK